jgi:hypothetical protein
MILHKILQGFLRYLPVPRFHWLLFDSKVNKLQPDLAGGHLSVAVTSHDHFKKIPGEE